jgi:hypothetical protein
MTLSAIETGIFPPDMLPVHDIEESSSVTRQNIRGIKTKGKATPVVFA